MYEIIDGKAISTDMKEELKVKVEELASGNSSLPGSDSWSETIRLPACM